MQKADIYLYRAKFIKPSQQLFFTDDLSPKEIFWKAIIEKPSLKMYNCVWHIGNIEKVTNDSGVFAIGKTTSKIADKYDEKTKNFKNEENQESPFTLVYYNLKIGLVSIVSKTKVSKTTNSIATKLCKLFSETEIVKNQKVNVEIEFIKNPITFIKLIDSAYAITKFIAHFSGPNPFDADEHFQKPMSVYLQNANGIKGKTEIIGEDLDSDVIHSTTVSIASTGNNASATIFETENSQSQRITLGDKQVFVPINFDELDHREILLKIDEKYYSVREL